VREQDPKRVLQDVGRKVAELRAEMKLTQEAFAESVLGVSLKYAQALEAGRENLTVESLVALANKAGVKVAWLFEAPLSRKVRRGRPPKE
jgi:transcriptional regulator with XRE-family HTH domain